MALLKFGYGNIKIARINISVGAKPREEALETKEKRSRSQKYMGASKKTVLWFGGTGTGDAGVRGLKAGLGLEGRKGCGVDGGSRDSSRGGEMEEKSNLKKQVVAVLSTKELEKKRRIKYQAAPAASAAPTAPAPAQTTAATAAASSISTTTTITIITITITTTTNKNNDNSEIRDSLVAYAKRNSGGFFN
ncbi:hypothetical protein HZH68_013439 [Vespula germanica]|uniref:Uncharacterized protein n=1 Tax=Vespula germanica TaxID=30212 RepID=A0A834JFQ3_VESGE|nr:hypothetical protein HZH68_013439 [Vespula germanica]